MNAARPHASTRRRFAALAAGIAGLAAVAVLHSPRLAAQGAVYFDSEVKAAFLYHFGTYVSWPVDVGDTVTIAVVGAELVAAELDAFLPGKEIAGRGVVVHRVARPADLDDVEILFIGSDESANLAEYVRAADGRPILVVSDSPGGLRSGSMINFRVVQNRVRFEISQPAAQAAGLELSSRLLAAAIRVDRAG